MNTETHRLRVRLNYPIERVREPVIYNLIRDHGLIPNVRTANIDPHSGGVLELDLTGDPARISAALEWLHSLGIQVERLDGEAQ